MKFHPLLLSIALLSLYACDGKPTESNQSQTDAAPSHHAAADAQHTPATEKPDAMPAPSAADVGNLARAMGGGAAGIMPDDAPKDKYGKPYIIGKIGNVPVNLPDSATSSVEYEDSPGFDINKLRTYKPAKRSYDSAITSFGFDLHYTDGVVMDYQVNQNQFEKERNIPGNDWIHVGVNAGSRAPSDNLYLNRFLETKTTYPLENYRFIKSDENPYGLESYIRHELIDKRPHVKGDSLYVKRNSEGNVVTYIKCSNNEVPSPPCTHHFMEFDDFVFDAYISYDRHNLYDWQKIEEAARNHFETFRASPQETSESK